MMSGRPPQAPTFPAPPKWRRFGRDRSGSAGPASHWPVSLQHLGPACSSAGPRPRRAVIRNRGRSDGRRDAPGAADCGAGQEAIAGEAHLPRSDGSHDTLHRCGARRQTALPGMLRSRLGAGFRVKEFAPGKDATFPASLEILMNVSMHMLSCLLHPDFNCGNAPPMPLRASRTRSPSGREDLRLWWSL